MQKIVMTAKAFNIRIATVIATVLLASLTSASAADGYRSSLLHDMSMAMNMADSIGQLPDGTHVARLSYLERPVTVVVELGSVSHIGYSIFSKEHRDLAYSPFFDMMERYALLEKLPMNRVKSVERELSEEGIRFYCGSLSVLPTLFEMPDVEFSLEYIDGKKYHASWRKNDQNVAVIETPFTYGLLHGTSMEEDESNLISDFQRLSATQLAETDWTEPTVSRESLYVYNPESSSMTHTEIVIPDEFSDLDEAEQTDSVSTPASYKYYVKRGEAYYFDNLNSNRYYTIDNERIAALCEPEYPFESLANILTSMEVPNSLVVDANIKQYNYRSTSVTLPLSAMVKYFLDRGCTPFVGLLKRNDDNMTALLIMRNETEGYCHLLRLNAPASVTGSPEGTVTARVTPYIPISKISSLFDESTESKQSNPSHIKNYNISKTMNR